MMAAILIVVSALLLSTVLAMAYACCVAASRSVAFDEASPPAP